MPTLVKIAEFYHTIQGEGSRFGRASLFLRLAGCNVGRYKQNHLIAQRHKVELKVLLNHAICTSFTGEEFVCDTNYRSKKSIDADTVFNRLREHEQLVITGGEPLLVPLFINEVADLIDNKNRLQIETSGTKPLEDLNQDKVFITCSPKEPFIVPNIPFIDEFKFLVRTEDDVAKVLGFLMKYDIPSGMKPIYLQPINKVNKINPDSLKACMKGINDHPFFRLSPQVHKMLRIP